MDNNNSCPKLRFHAIDNPVTDPVSVRRARSSSTLNKTPAPKSPSTPKLKLSSKWVPFSQRDSAALEKAYKVNCKRERYKQIKKLIFYL